MPGDQSKKTPKRFCSRAFERWTAESFRWAPMTLAILVALTSAAFWRLAEVRANDAEPSTAAGIQSATFDQSAVTDSKTPTFTAEQLDHFETHVRPVLIEHCYQCHSADATPIRGGIRLDNRRAIIDGHLAIPGDVAASHLIEAIEYLNPAKQMPPGGRLADDDIAALTQWVSDGLPWPAESGAVNLDDFDLPARRAAHWCWQPPTASEAPSVGASESVDWVRGDLDQHILARLETEGLRPSPSADRATLIRRLSFDLTGLPPSAAEVQAFVDDPAEDAYEQLVDRLLASPHFGEQWGRHWLDLVRYGESYGHEFDFDIFNAWRYRDYVIRAFNQDVPYDDLIFEHLAGDLMASPRLDTATGTNQSVQGTGWFWMGEQTHSPVDVKGHQADFIANQIDVIGRAFSGVTIACARCHDHKFDAISTEDYYALYGILESTSWTPTAINPIHEAAPLESPSAAQAAFATLIDERDRIANVLREQWRPERLVIAPYLVAAHALKIQIDALDPKAEGHRETIAALIREAAAHNELDDGRLSRWVRQSRSNVQHNRQHPLQGWSILMHRAPDRAQAWWQGIAEPSQSEPEFIGDAALVERDGDDRLVDFARPEADKDGTSGTNETSGDGFDGFIHGAAFAGHSTVTPGTLLLRSQPAAGFGQLAVYSGRSSAAVTDRLQGVLQSRAIEIEKRYVHVLAQGRNVRLNFILDGFRLNRHPIYGDMRQEINAAYPRWYTVDLEKWQNAEHTLYAELTDLSAGDPAAGGSPDDADGTIYRVIASDEGQPPATIAALYATLQLPANLDNDPVAGIASTYEKAIRDAAAFWCDGAEPESPEDFARLALLSFVLSEGLIDLPVDKGAVIDPDDLLTIHRERAAQIRRPALALAAADTTPLDSPIFIRGSHQVPGEPAARDFLEAIVGDDANDVAHRSGGSGRYELAESIVDPQNPLTARVAVNRIWHHLFGRGLVSTVDNFGVLGAAPSHPELLDTLAIQFVQQDDWSTKAMVRRIVTSATYRQSSAARDTNAERVDPENLLLHRQNLRRLTAESIRDSLLAVSGRLDPKLYGRSVPVHLTAFMEGRGRPESGPLDGEGRRSIYVQVRRNFLSPMMLAFDTPAPFSTVGRRNVTNVPAQALFLMNDPLVHQQAEHWARQLLDRPDASIESRVDHMWQTAFGQPPSADDLQNVRQYLNARAEHFGLGAEQRLTDVRPWQDLAHVMFNAKSFIYIR